jgi:hypothetical protein
MCLHQIEGDEDKMTKIFIKKDIYNSPSGFEMENNDFNGWAMYVRIEDIVLRINHIHVESGTIKYDNITPDFFVPNEFISNYIFGNIIETEIFKKQKPDEYKEHNKHYRVIRRYN